jgi:hypothetical protein
MNNYWRIQAKHTTVCPLCRGYIKIGDWIVREDGCTRWSHAVCPGFARSKHVRTEEERNISRAEIKFTEEGRTAYVTHVWE